MSWVQSCLRGAAVAALGLLVPACPKCPQGFHQVVFDHGGFNRTLHRADEPNTPLDTTLDVVTSHKYAFKVTGTSHVALQPPFGPNGIEGSTAGEGAPAPSMPLGALLGVVDRKYYFIGASMTTTFQSAGRLYVMLNFPPPGSAPPSPQPAPPNTVFMDLDMRVGISETKCVKDDQPVVDPEPKPAALTWSQVYTQYFGPKTPGHCQDCHTGAPGRPNFGYTQQEMYAELKAIALLDGGGNARLVDSTTSPLSWCNNVNASLGDMPKDLPASLNPTACGAVRSWVDAGALNN
jgi:hypothetical protein